MILECLEVYIYTSRFARRNEFAEGVHKTYIIFGIRVYVTAASMSVMKTYSVYLHIPLRVASHFRSTPTSVQCKSKVAAYQFT